MDAPGWSNGFRLAACSDRSFAYSPSGMLGNRIALRCVLRCVARLCNWVWIVGRADDLQAAVSVKSISTAAAAVTL